MPDFTAGLELYAFYDDSDAKNCNNGWKIRRWARETHTSTSIMTSSGYAVKNAMTLASML